MNLVAPRVAAYLDELVPPRPARLAELEAEARRTGFPIIGPATGHLCYLLARLSNARHVFELGSGFGYSTAWFARAVKENGGGTVHHVVWDEVLPRFAGQLLVPDDVVHGDRKSTRLNSSHLVISYAVFCLKKKKRSCRR